MRLALAALLFAAPAFADSKPKQPAAKTEQTCKKRVVGKGLDRKVICEFEQEIVITGHPPKPNVVIAPVDGRKVTGRPKLTDPLTGLPRQRER